MSLNLNFKLLDRDYVLHDGDEPIGERLSEISVCLDRDTGTRHKLGDPEVVSAWHLKTCKTFRDAGFPQMADDLVVITGRFLIEDVNKMIDISGYAFSFYKKLLEGDVSEYPLMPANQKLDERDAESVVSERSRQS